MILVIL